MKIIDKKSPFPTLNIPRKKLKLHAQSNKNYISYFLPRIWPLFCFCKILALLLRSCDHLELPLVHIPRVQEQGHKQFLISKIDKNRFMMMMKNFKI